jgi:tripartite-type tricarboxylate transporter receptor subunit TctC
MAGVRSLILLRALIAAGVAIGIAVAPLPGFAQAQPKFPTKPIRLVVGISVGSQADTLVRMIAHKLSESWGQSVVVDNRAGAGGALAAGLVAKAAPDGHTLLYSVGFAISAAAQPDLPYDPVKDFTGVAQIGFGTQVLSVAPALGVRSVDELIALAKAQPGKIVFGSSAVGTGTHLSGARFAFVAGIKVATVAFKSASEALLQLLAGRTHYSVLTLVVARPFIDDGKVRALAVLLPQRSPVLPDVPTLAETLPDFKRPEVSAGFLAPAGTPRPVLNQISKEMARILYLPDMKERLDAGGFQPQPTTPDEYDKILRGQIETLSKLVREIGLRPK